MPQDRASLDSYRARLTAVEQALRFAENAYTAPLVELEELRGRLLAYRAKAQATGRGADVAVNAAYRRAETVLGERPCPLPEARDLVAAYQRLLSAGGRE